MNSLKVLLVDDEVEFTTTLAERLRLRGMEATVASNGEVALECVERESPQVVVLDLMMPGIGGIEVLQRIRSSHPDIQVILLTGHGSTVEGIKGIQLGAVDCLMKPLDIGELIEKIRKAAGTAEEG
jgi:DNA-binding response OmpR family regulator